MRQLNIGAYSIRMQKINTEKKYKYLQLEKSSEFKKSLLFAKTQAALRNPCAFQKIRRIYRILALFQKSGGFTKTRRFTENQADLQNLGALQKIRWIYKILALYRKSGGFEKSWRFTENQEDNRILAGVKIPEPGEKPAGLEKAGGPLTV